MRPIATAIALALTLVVASANPSTPSRGGPRPTPSALLPRSGAPATSEARQPHEAGVRAARDAADPHRRGHRAIGHVLSSDMPISSTRRFDVHVKRTFMNPQSNRRGSNEEVVLSGDRPGRHAVRRLRAPDDRATASTTASSSTRSRREPASPSSASRTSARSITRGVLIDVAALKGVDMLADTLRDHGRGSAAGAAARQSLTLQPGDAVIIHTGWGKLLGARTTRGS